MEIHALRPHLPHIPDDLTVVQFLFDSDHPIRPRRTWGTPWLIDDTTGHSLNEQELRERTNALASGLKYKYGIAEDDVVLLFSRNHIGKILISEVKRLSVYSGELDYPVAIWAVHRLGGIISGANPDFSVNELLYQIQASKATVIICHPDALSIAQAAAEQSGLSSHRVILFNTEGSARNKISIEDLVQFGRTHASAFQERKLKPGEARTKLAYLSFSSGTTGRPKAVAIPHYAPIVNMIQIAVHNRVHEDYCAWEDRRYRPGDVAIGVLPLYHLYGLVINLNFILFTGMSLVIVPKFNFVEMLKSIVRHKITHLYLVPPMVVLLCKHAAVKEYELHRYVRLIMCGAAPLSHELNYRLFKLLPDAHIGQAYGMTETCTATIMWSVDSKRGKSGSAGQLMPGTIARVVKEDGTLAGYDEPGELIIYSPSIALGYANNKQATLETFLDGWVRTGDEVRIDKTGEVWVLDRLKEIMKVKGFQVAPAELEGCVLEHPDVRDACVVGVPDDYSGEVPMAFIVLNTDAQARFDRDPQQANVIKSSIIKHVADNKVAYKHLAGGIEFVDVIPASPSGKLLRRVLRERAKEIKANSKIRAKL